MYLKKIEMRGFKSFADKTVISFEQGVTCVVGPNGSGKSNITDALRWVLGEQRAKTLRGSKMEDVIFSGTKSRKALNLAEVILTFDNREHFFPIDFDEVSVMRRVYRSGESEYQINQTPCRLKDLRELFLDTGIGREGYSIIGQGRIDEVLSSHKEERRMLFEDAAGILKFKLRKEQAEKKLSTTSDNMDRVNDILSEIEGRVLPLEKESQRAHQYLLLTEKLKNVEVRHYADRYVTSEQQLLDALNTQKDYEDQLSAMESRKVKRESSYQQADQDRTFLSRAIREAEENIYALKNRQSELTGEKHVLQEKKINAHKNESRLQEEIQELEEERTKTKESTVRIESEIARLECEEQDKNEQLKTLTQERSEKLNELNAFKLKYVQDKEKSSQYLNRIELAEQSSRHIEEEVHRYEIQIQQLKEDQKKEMKASTDVTHVENQIKAQHESLENQVENLKAKKEKEESHYRYLSEQLSKCINQMEKNAHQVSKLKAERDLLQKLEDEYEGYDRGVKSILQSLENQQGIHGIVASLIQVPPAYETAIEVGLGRALQNIVCDTVHEAKRSIDFLRDRKQGRVTFLPLEHFKEKDVKKSVFQGEKGFVGLANELVQTSEPYRALVDHLLGRTLIVDSFETATRFLKNKQNTLRIITLKGDILIPGGAITGGSFQSKVSSVLGRRRQIEELSEALKIHLEKMDEDVQNKKHLDDLRTQSREHLAKIQKELETSNVELIKIKNEKDYHAYTRSQHEATIEKMNQNLKKLDHEKSEQEKILKEKREEVIALSRDVEQIKGFLLHADEDLDGLEKVLEKHTQMMTDLKMDISSLLQKKQFINQDFKRHEEEMAHLDSVLEKRIQQLDADKKFQINFDEELQKVIEELSKTESLILVHQGRLRDDEEKRKAIVNQARSLEEEIRSLTLNFDSIKEKKHQIELKMAQYTAEKDNASKELWEKYEMSVAEALAIEATEEEVDLKKLRLDIKMMGTVNLSAIEEYEEVKERYGFLMEQKEDLNASKAQLEKLIRSLEKEMKTLFLAEFNQINAYFKETFQTLFHGGDAELILADDEDILNCNIEIVSQPPGKRLQSINLLSGGEKALTAIALLFAILKTKPTPFCVLDEIEAALDDVNVYRFAEFIKDYASKSQFVVITHRKGTMQVADTLYGVTMEEYGVSKVISVKLDEVNEDYE